MAFDDTADQKAFGEWMKALPPIGEHVILPKHVISPFTPYVQSQRLIVEVTRQLDELMNACPFWEPLRKLYPLRHVIARLHQHCQDDATRNKDGSYQFASDPPSTTFPDFDPVTDDKLLTSFAMNRGKGVDVDHFLREFRKAFQLLTHFRLIDRYGSMFEVGKCMYAQEERPNISLQVLTRAKLREMALQAAWTMQVICAGNILRTTKQSRDKSRDENDGKAFWLDVGPEISPTIRSQLIHTRDEQAHKEGTLHEALDVSMFNAVKSASIVQTCAEAAVDFFINNLEKMVKFQIRFLYRDFLGLDAALTSASKAAKPTSRSASATNWRRKSGIQRKSKSPPRAIRRSPRFSSNSFEVFRSLEDQY